MKEGRKEGIAQRKEGSMEQKKAGREEHMDQKNDSRKAGRQAGRNVQGTYLLHRRRSYFIGFHPLLFFTLE